MISQELCKHKNSLTEWMRLKYFFSKIKSREDKSEVYHD